MMHNLRPAILEQGLVAALQWMASRHEKRTGIACRFTSSRETVALPAGVPLVAPHRAGGADQRQQACAGEPGRDRPHVAAGTLSLEIADNGRGLSRDLGQGALVRHPRAARARRHGRRLGRPVELAGRGTTLILSVPCRPRRPAARPGRGPELAAAHDEHDPSLGRPVIRVILATTTR